MAKPMFSGSSLSMLTSIILYWFAHKFKMTAAKTGRTAYIMAFGNNATIVLQCNQLVEIVSTYVSEFLLLLLLLCLNVIATLQSYDF